MLGRLIPEKQILSDQLKQVQQNSLHSRCLIDLHVLFVLLVHIPNAGRGDFCSGICFIPE